MTEGGGIDLAALTRRLLLGEFSHFVLPTETYKDITPMRPGIRIWIRIHFSSVVDPDPVGSETFGRIQVRSRIRAWSRIRNKSFWIRIWAAQLSMNFKQNFSDKINNFSTKSTDQQTDRPADRLCRGGYFLLPHRE